ncbi:hypothetical protein HK102_001335 [Quaeritorhiza haematococci]|nr:hypothetical protein HK102_001335 [Quaeritorhiza haematococci]
MPPPAGTTKSNLTTHSLHDDEVSHNGSAEGAAHAPSGADLLRTSQTSSQPHTHDATSSSQQPAQSRKFLKIFTLAPDVSDLNFVAYLLAVMLAICLFVFLNSSQGFVLGEAIQVPKDQLGSSAGSLSFYDELLSCVLVWVWGIASDKIGRASVYSAGYLFMGVGLLAFTYATNVYPELLLLRFVFAIGGSAASSMLTAVMADFAGDESRGIISALVGEMSGVGALLALFVFLRLPSNFGGGLAGLRKTYFIVGGISLVFAFFLFFALRVRKRKQPAAGKTIATVNSNGASSTPNETAVDVSAQQEGGSAPNADNPSTGLVEKSNAKSITRIAVEGVAAMKDGKILVLTIPLFITSFHNKQGYIGGFLARASSVIITIFLPLWMYKYYIDKGACSVRDPNDPDIRETCREAYVKASTLSGVAQTLVLVGAPIFGILADRFYRPLATLIAAVIGLIGYLALFFIRNPTSPSMYLIVCLVGLGEIGMIVGSLALVTAAYVPHDIRGSVAGVYSFFGAAGILLNTKLGGYLFDTWTEQAPFFLMAVAHVVCIIVCVWVLARDVVQVLRERKEGGVEGGEGTSPNGERRTVLGELRYQQLRQQKLFSNEHEQ